MGCSCKEEMGYHLGGQLFKQKLIWVFIDGCPCKDGNFF